MPPADGLDVLAQCTPCVPQPLKASPLIQLLLQTKVLRTIASAREFAEALAPPRKRAIIADQDLPGLLNWVAEQYHWNRTEQKQGLNRIDVKTSRLSKFEHGKQKHKRHTVTH